MTTPSRVSTHLLVLALGVAFAAPVLAADAPKPAASSVAPDAAPAATANEPALDSALEQSPISQYGDCALFCDGHRYTYSFVTRELCCSGTLTCPDGSPSFGYAFFPYQGFAEFCSV